MSKLEVLRDWLKSECKLDCSVEKLKNLTWLDLPYRELTNIPPEIGQLKNLTHLYLYDNKFTQLPDEISELKNLIYLDLSNNKLTQLPPEISQLKKLTNLHLHKNKLTQLPPEILNLKLNYFYCDKMFVKESDIKMIKFLDKFNQKYQIVQETLVTGVLI